MSGSSTPKAGDTVYLKRSNETSKYIYNYWQTVYIRNDGSDYSTTIYKTAISEDGAPVTFESEGTFNIQFCVFTDSANYYINSLKFVVGRGSGEQQSDYPVADNGTDLPDVYIRLIDTTEDETLDIEEGSGTYTMAVKMYSWWQNWFFRCSIWI